MSSRQSRLLASTDLESFPMWYECPLGLVYLIILSPIPKDHYVFCYEVLADFVEKMEAYHNFKSLM